MKKELQNHNGYLFIGIFFGTEVIFLETEYQNTVQEILGDFTEERLNAIHFALTGKSLNFGPTDAEEELKNKSDLDMKIELPLERWVKINEDRLNIHADQISELMNKSATKDNWKALYQNEKKDNETLRVENDRLLSLLNVIRMDMSELSDKLKETCSRADNGAIKDNGERGFKVGDKVRIVKSHHFFDVGEELKVLMSMNNNGMYRCGYNEDGFTFELVNPEDIELID